MTLSKWKDLGLRSIGPVLSAVLVGVMATRSEPLVAPAPLLLVTVVAVSAVAGGMISGLVSTLIIGVYTFVDYQTGGIDRPFVESVVHSSIVASSLAIALLVGLLRRRGLLYETELERRRSAEEETKEIRSLLDTVEAVVYEASAEPFQILRMNAKVKDIVGYGPERFLTQQSAFDALIHPTDRSRVLAERQSALGSGSRYDLIYRILDSDAKTVWVHDVAEIVRDRRGRSKTIKGRLVDITSQKSAEQRLSTVYAAGEAISDSPTLEEAASFVLRTVCESLEWKVGALWKVVGDQLACVDVWFVPGSELEPFVHITRATRFPPGVGLPGRVWQSRRSAWIRDVVQDSNFPRADQANQVGLHGAFAFPILSAQQIIGVMEFFSDEIREPDRDLLQMLSSVGHQIGQRIERARVEGVVRESEARKTAILESALDCVITIDHEGVITEFNPAAEKTLGYSRDDVVGRRIDEVIIPPVLRDRHLAALNRYVKTGEPTIIGKRLEMPAIRADGSEILVELSITPVEIEGSLPMFTGFLRDITESKYQEQIRSFFAEVSTILASSLDYEQVLRNIVKRATPFLCDYCTIDSLEADGSVRRIGHAYADDSLAEKLTPFDAYLESSLEGHPIVRSLRAGATEVIPEVGDDTWALIAENPYEIETFRSTGISSLMVVPLLARKKSLGAISFISTSNDRRYGADEVALAEELAKRVSLQLDNAIRYRERSRIARTLEASLLPPKLPDIPGMELVARYRSGAEELEVGGDFYDVFPYGNKRWGVILGDVSGKGARAAALTALVRYTVRAEALQEREPRKILAQLNESVLEQSPPEQFCTATYARLEPTEKGAHVTVVSGGHPLPYLITAEGEVRQVGQTGTLLGVMSEVELNEEHLELSPGDTVVFYTDGVVEARSNGEIFGQVRLSQLLASNAGKPAADLAHLVESAATEFAEGMLRDDLAVLVIRVQ